MEMKLYNLVTAKTGYISDKLFKEALKVAKSRKAEYQHLTEAEQLEYIANIMAVWVINKDLKGVRGNEYANQNHDNELG
jgi:hypothetical protein